MDSPSGSSGTDADDENPLLLGIVAVATATFVAGRFAVSPLLPEVISTFGITAAAAGLGLTVMWAVQALSQFPGGRLVDAWTPKTVLVGGVTIAVVGLGLLMAAGRFITFVLGLAVFGLGMGLYLPAMVTVLSRSFVTRRARAFSVNEVAVNVGGIAAGGLAVGAIALGTWRVAFVPVLVLLVAVAVTTHRCIPEPYRFGQATLDLAGTRSRLFGDRRWLAMLLVFALLSFSWQGVSTFLPTLLQVEKGFGPALASQAFAGLFFAGLVATLVVAPQGDRFGPLRLASVALVVGASGLGLLVWSSSTIAALGGILLFGFGGTAFWPLMITALVGVLPDDTVGGDFGAFSTVFTTIGSLGPASVGLVADLSGFQVAFAGLGGCVATAAVVLGWLALTQSS